MSAPSGSSRACVRARESCHEQGNLRNSDPHVQLGLNTGMVLSKSLFECRLRNLHIARVDDSISPRNTFIDLLGHILTECQHTSYVLAMIPPSTNRLHFADSG